MKTLDFHDWFPQVIQSAGWRGQLAKAAIELTYGCNLRCVHCYNPTHKAHGEWTTRQFCQLLEDLAKQGCLWVNFTGGELFSRPDALEIIRYARNLGLLSNILTNATLVTPSLAKAIKAVNPHCVEVSLYGATPQTYEAVTQVPGSYSRFVQGVESLQAEGVPLLLKIVLMSLNVHEFNAMIQFARERGIRHQVSTHIRPNSDGSKAPLEYRISTAQAFEVWKQLSGQRLAEKVSSQSCALDSLEENRAAGPFNCACGKTNAAVTPYGKMNLCISIPFPQVDLSEFKIQEGWQSLKDLVASSEQGELYECEGCGLAKVCARGVNDGWLEQGKFDGGCIPYYRELAEKESEFLQKEFSLSEGGSNGSK